MLLVEELAGGDLLPERYVLQVEDRPTVVGALPVAQVPVIDLGLLSQQVAAGGGEEVEKLRSALVSWGIFMVSGHGVDPCMMDAMWKAAKDFFGQPIEEKKKYANLADCEEGYEDYHQGYGTKQLKAEGETTLDWSDRMRLQVEPQDERKLELWPESFKDILHDYCVQQHRGLLDTLLPAMERVMGLGDGFLLGRLGGPATTYCRINYYLPCPRPDLVVGVAAHADATLISVVMVDDTVGGLQVLKDDVWYDVPASTDPHGLLIMVGDFAEILTNGLLKSPVHRVVTNPHKDRTSVVMFYMPDIDKEIGPADELIGNTQRARYKKVKGSEYLIRNYGHMARGKRTLDSLMI
ncbi:jasmonate-induced oxygenase 4-like [Lolium rigidum]|uniref:jasmonate-induced oxygenase 4-like n=1 Tax=Lolium rigidum TaxID=89674 RepID=UPI001F5D26AC|nr:jasmonate-induced oxygenase 4-like [Lolium rigidum]